MDNSDQFLSDGYIQEDSEAGNFFKILKKQKCFHSVFQKCSSLLFIYI